MFLNGRSKITMMERKRKWFTSAEDTRRINLSRFNPKKQAKPFFKTSRDDSKVNINEVGWPGLWENLVLVLMSLGTRDTSVKD